MKYFISGVGPGESGASRFFSVAKAYASDSGFKTLFPYRHRSFKRLYSDNKILAILYLVRVVLQKLIFNLRCLYISLFCPRHIVLMHPQGIGIIITLILISRSKKISFYTIDNSFFCMKSYNFHPDVGECFRCVGFVEKAHEDCRPFPVQSFSFCYRYFLKKFVEISARVEFFCQTSGQEALVKEHFGSHVNTSVIGMESLDMMINDELVAISPIDCENFGSDYLVFHASQDEAKGIGLALELAKYMPTYKFVFPFLKPKNLRPTQNCFFIPCSWETGLNYLVRNAKAVLCLSMWSAPIEGALIKSLMQNGKVVTYQGMRSFSRELPEGVVIKITGMQDYEKVLTILGSERELELYKNAATDWAFKFVKSQSVSSLFCEG